MWRGGEFLLAKLDVPTWERIFHLRRAFVAGMTVEEMVEASGTVGDGDPQSLGHQVEGQRAPVEA